MKKAFLLYAALIVALGLKAQFPPEEVIISPDSLHLYFHGCSPHGELVTVTNNTSEDLVINSCWAENFIVEFLYEGENIAQTGFIVPVMETVEFEVFASPTIKSQQDVYGTIYIDTDFGIYTITIYYESTYAIDEDSSTFTLSPNPANGFISIKGENMGQLSVYNVLGQQVESIMAEGIEAKISTTAYPNGMYFVRTADGKTQRFVIAH